MKQKSIGFFGGSFDPVHCGHLHLAISLLERHKLDHVLFCPTCISPFKAEKNPHVSALHREEMVRRAIAPLPHFSVLDFEIRNEKPSFTIDTIKHLKKLYAEQSQDIKIHLLIGDDMLDGLPRWKEVEELLRLAPPLVGSRMVSPKWPEGLSEESVALLNAGHTQIPILDISSTELRERLKKRQYCGHLIPFQVLEYIHQNQLYE